MSLAKKIVFGAAASWFSRGVSIVLGLVLLPILFRTLPKEELGVWLLLGQSGALLGMLDFGFGVTLTRKIAFATGRAGVAQETEFSEASRQEIADLLATGLRLYRGLAVCAFLISFGSGYFYLQSLPLAELNQTSVWIAWGVLCLSQALVLWAAPWTCLLQGVGYVGWDAILTSFVNVLTLLGQILVVLLGGGIVALATVAGIGALLQRGLILGFAKRRRPGLFNSVGSWSPQIFKSMLPLARLAWLTALGGSLILYSDQFVITSLQGAQELTSYRAAWVLVHNFTIVAVTFGLASGVFVSHLWQAGEIAQVHRLLERNVRIGWLVMLTVSGVMLFAGEALFRLWLGPGNFIGLPVLAAFLITETLETQSCIISAASRATGDEAFAWSSLAAGGLKLGLSIWLAHHYGLLGVALGTVFALCLTNHWYVPSRGLKSLQYSRWKLVRSTLLPLAGYLALLSLVLWVVHRWTHNAPALWQLSGAVIAASLLLLPVCWFFVLEAHERTRLGHRFGFRLSLP